MRTFLKRWLLPIFGSALALYLVFALYGSLDFALFLQGLRGANMFWIAILAATILLEQLMSGWKWRQILFDVKPVGTLRLTGALLAGYGANVLVPLGISPLNVDLGKTIEQRASGRNFDIDDVFLDFLLFYEKRRKNGMLFFVFFEIRYQCCTVP